MDFNPSIPGYVFEYVPTSLASGGVGLYINDSLKYTVTLGRNSTSTEK